MTISDRFQRRLTERFDGRFRVRWSPSRSAFQVEQKVGRMADLPADAGEDHQIRTRDGYVLVFEITPGDRMPCEGCKFPLKVPVFETAQITCPLCGTKAILGFWPIDGDRIIEHLEFLDPLKGRDMGIWVRTRQAENRLALERRHLNEIEAISKYRAPQLLGRPQVGWTTDQRYFR